MTSGAMNGPYTPTKFIVTGIDFLCLQKEFSGHK